MTWCLSFRMMDAQHGKTNASRPSKDFAPEPSGIRAQRRIVLDSFAPRLLPHARGPLTGTVKVPGDKSISHRVALLALLADGPCRAEGWLVSEDTLASLAAVRKLGATVVRDGDQVTITPPVARPTTNLTLDCGNSGTTCRLLCGLLAGWLPDGVAVTLTGDASLSSRPMKRVVAPLREMGADITFLQNEDRLPLRVTGAPLHGIHYDLPVPSAQVKSALLLAGLQAAGTTTISGDGGSRDHTELLLQTMGISCAADRLGADLMIQGGGRPTAFSVQVPGDPSTAAFLHVAAALVPGSDLTTVGLSLNPTRIGALKALRRSGARVEIMRPHGPPGGEPIGDVRVRFAPLHPLHIDGPEVPALVDEIPILAVLATGAEGETVITGAAELRVKESDRLALMAANLQQLGVKVTETADGLRIAGPVQMTGGSATQPKVLQTGGDHRIAMAMSVAALISAGESTLDDFECVAVSFPRFFETFATIIGDGISDRPF